MNAAHMNAKRIMRATAAPHSWVGVDVLAGALAGGGASSGVSEAMPAALRA